MNPDSLAQVLDAVTLDRRLLTHPFYRRWEAGELSRAELADYAQQYRHFEAILPTVLASCRDALADGEGRALVSANLDDELGTSGAPAHLALFDRFATAVGSTPAVAPSPAMAHLVDVYHSAAAAGPGAGLAAVAAYEMQAAEVAASKGQGLRRWYGLAAAATEFWDVHAELDRDHRRWVVDALSGVDVDAAEVADSARRAADAWWAFLDEREEFAAAA
jgi:pyrroloquinoline-quinone synthase